MFVDVMLGFHSTNLSVAEYFGDFQVCVQIFSQGVLSQALSVLISTANGTATGKTDTSKLLYSS